MVIDPVRLGFAFVVGAWLIEKYLPSDIGESSMSEGINRTQVNLPSFFELLKQRVRSSICIFLIFFA